MSYSSYDRLRVAKKEKIAIAKQLGYSNEIINRLKEAKTEGELEVCMITGRHQQSKSQKR